MAIYDGYEVAYEHLLDVAKHCIQAAYRAPQITGTLELKTKILTQEALLPIIELMEQFATKKDDRWAQLPQWGDYWAFKEAYDAGTPPVVIILGADLTQSDTDWNCGACGFSSCLEFNKYAREHKSSGFIDVGPSCNWKAFDFGMAVCWAACTASQFSVENRIQGSSGTMAGLLGYIDGCSSIVGMPLGPLEEYWYNRNMYIGKLTYQDWFEIALTRSPELFGAFTGLGKQTLKVKDRWWEKPPYLLVGEDHEQDMLVLEAMLKARDVMKRERKKRREQKEKPEGK